MYQWMVIENYNDFYDLFSQVSLEVIDEIDRLWMDYSAGKFGIKGQAKIYRDLEGTKSYNEEVWNSLIYRDLEGTKSYNEEVWNSFGDLIGWTAGGKWLAVNEVAYHATNESLAFTFPILIYNHGLESDGGRLHGVHGFGLGIAKVGIFRVSSLASRLKGL